MKWTSEKIRTLRRNRYGETQAAFARRLGVDTRTISRWETGSTPARAAQRLLDILAGEPIQAKEKPKKRIRDLAEKHPERPSLRERLGRSK